jgi:hypothetical protein
LPIHPIVLDHWKAAVRIARVTRFVAYDRQIDIDWTLDPGCISRFLNILDDECSINIVSDGVLGPDYLVEVLLCKVVGRIFDDRKLDRLEVAAELDALDLWLVLGWPVGGALARFVPVRPDWEH